MRVLIDYRPALRERSGVGEYTHQLVTALLAGTAPDASATLDLTLFSSSWKDRLRARRPSCAALTAVDRRVPVRLLNFAWHASAGRRPRRSPAATFDVDALAASAAAAVARRRAGRHDSRSEFPRRTPSGRAPRSAATIPRSSRAHARARRSHHRARRGSRPAKSSGSSASRRTRSRSARPARRPGRRGTAPPKRLHAVFGTLEPARTSAALLDAYEQLLSRPAQAGRYGSHRS